MALGVLIPAFNEAGKIDAVLSAMPEIVLGHSVEVVVVDDGSTDETGAMAEASGAMVLRQPYNGGKGCALRRGMEEVAGLGLQAVVWMDSDGQHRPADLPSIVGPVLRSEVDMVVGSRYLTPGRTRAPLNRRLVRGAAVAAIARITSLDLTDPFSGYRCFSPRATRAIDLIGDCYESELEALFSVWRAGFTVREVPIDRVYGPDTSKMGFHRGRVRGRFDVVRGYVRTVKRELRAGDVDDKELVVG